MEGCIIYRYPPFPPPTDPPPPPSPKSFGLGFSDWSQIRRQEKQQNEANIIYHRGNLTK